MSKPTRRPPPAVNRRSGFVLITCAACMIGLLAVVGLATDLGRVYVIRNELQVFSDEAASAAAFELDGTSSGISRARTIASLGPGSGVTPNRWNFATQAVTTLPAQFAYAPTGPFDPAPASPAGERFVQVQATAAVNLYFLPLLPGIPTTQHLTAKAIAGQCPRFSLGDGLEPLSPIAHDTTDSDYGFSVGQLYTLRWAPSGARNKPDGNCAGDIGIDPGSSSDRGYVDVGQGTGASAVRNAVVNNSFFLPAPIEVGTVLSFLSGQQSVPTAMEERFGQDSDITSTGYSNYHGNGRRIVTVAVNAGPTARVVGFAAFFLHPKPCGTSNTSPCCAEYIGPAVISSTRRGAGTPGLYTVQLVQ